jgi:hypothetical protein
VQLADTGEIRQRIAAYESRLLGDQLDSGRNRKTEHSVRVHSLHKKLILLAGEQKIIY